MAIASRWLTPQPYKPAFPSSSRFRFDTSDKVDLHGASSSFRQSPVAEYLKIAYPPQKTPIFFGSPWCLTSESLSRHLPIYNKQSLSFRGLS